MVDKLDWKLRRLERERLKGRLAEAKDNLQRMQHLESISHSETLKNFAAQRRQLAEERVEYYEERMKHFKFSGTVR